MLQALSFLSQLMLLVSLLCLLAGLVRPVLVLWFLDRFNRLKVIQVYGGMALFWLMVWGVMRVL